MKDEGDVGRDNEEEEGRGKRRGKTEWTRSPKRNRGGEDEEGNTNNEEGEE